MCAYAFFIVAHCSRSHLQIIGPYPNQLEKHNKYSKGYITIIW